MIKQFKIPSLIAFLLLLSCEGDMNTIDFTENIGMGFYERLNQNNQKTFIIILAPEQNCHCLSGGELVNKHYRFGNTFVFNLYGIRIPKGCNDDYGMPYIDIDLGALPNGDYELQFNSSHCGIASLYITDTAYQVTMKRPENIDIMWGNARRFYDNTLWVEFYYSTPAELNKGLSLIDSLHTLGVKPSTLGDGYYFYFTKKGDNTVPNMRSYVPYTAPGHDIGYIFDYNFDDSKIKTLMENYRYTDGNLFITIETGKGTSIYSWRPY